MSDTATMHIDGAARGNPGPASYAVVLARPGEPVVEEAAPIGTATNNVAEYTALIEGLSLAAELGVRKLAVFSDSELLVKQMNGVYRVKNPELLDLVREAKQLAAGFEAVTIAHVRREQNKRADQIGNDALDGKPRRCGEPFVENLTPHPSSLRGKGTSSAPLGEGGGEGSARAAPASDAAVRDDALAILQSAAQAWAASGVGAVPVAAVWEQLWSVLEDSHVLKKKKVK